MVQENGSYKDDRNPSLSHGMPSLSCPRVICECGYETEGTTCSWSCPKCGRSYSTGALVLSSTNPGPHYGLESRW